MSAYSCLKKQKFSIGDYQIVPIRYEDRMHILKWRNEQIYHLRQEFPLTKIDQNSYFENVISRLYNQERPNQLLFSLLKNSKCIGYGGLVHINWIDKNAEISFIMDTLLEKEYFSQNWKIFLKLLEQVAFGELCFHKIFTFAFDVRPHLFKSLEDSDYYKEARLKEHYLLDKKYYDVIIHSKINPNYREF